MFVLVRVEMIKHVDRYWFDLGGIDEGRVYLRWTFDLLAWRIIMLDSNSWEKDWNPGIFVKLGTLR